MIRFPYPGDSCVYFQNWVAEGVGSGEPRTADRPRRFSSFFLPVAVFVALMILRAGGPVAAQSSTAASAPPLRAVRPVHIAPPVVHSAPRLNAVEHDPRDAGDLHAIESRVVPLVDHVRQCTVGLIVGDAQGSGVIVTDQGLVLTAAHVVLTPGRKIKVVLSDGKQLPGHALGVNVSSDCAAVQIDAPGPFATCKLSDLQALRAGDWCIATGHPGGYQEGRAPVVRLGRVVQMQEGFLQSDCPLLGGDSGGPLFDLNGNVIAIHSRIGARTSLNLHVPVTLVLRDWERLTKVAELNEARPEGMLGINGEDDPRGARITLVFRRSPADRAGLKSGDIVTEFGGQHVTGFKALQTLIGTEHPGAIVELKVLHDDQKKVIRATVAARPRE